MRRPVFYLWIPVLVFFSVFSSCINTDRNTNAVTDNYSPSNLPVTGNVPNSYSFVVDARSFNYAQSNGVQINADTLTIGITVTNFISGSGRIVITDGNGVSIYEKNINGAMVSGNVLQLTAMAKTVTLNLNNFTGNIVIGLSGK